MFGFSAVKLLVFVWGVVTAILVVLMIQRSILGFRETDRILTEDEGNILQNEQIDTVQRITHIDPWIRKLMWTSGTLLFLAFATWIYPGVAALIGH